MSDIPEFNAEDIEAREIIEHEEAATERSTARRVALQALYEIDCTDHQIGDVITTRLQAAHITRKASRYVQHLVTGVIEHRDRLDSIIREYAPEWPLEQVAIVDRNILRMAIFEFAVQTNMPVGVVIAEAIELAKLFGADGTARFVNGVMGSLARDVITIEADELDEEDEE